MNKRGLLGYNSNQPEDSIVWRSIFRSGLFMYSKRVYNFKVSGHSLAD